MFFNFVHVMDMDTLTTTAQTLPLRLKDQKVIFTAHCQVCQS